MLGNDVTGEELDVTAEWSAAMEASAWRRGWSRRSYQTARIIKKLKAIPEGTGSMMDHTMLLWTSDMGMNPMDHNKKNLPFVIAGKAAGRLKTGRMVDVAGMSHVRLLTALTYLLGVPTDGFGDARYDVGGPALAQMNGA